MRVLLIVAAVLLLVDGEKQYMLKTNKTPKSPLSSNSAVCDECKMLVARFDKALEDPEKVTELKAILRMLCHETSYVEECKVFVGRLDYFIEHIKPYLKNPEEACKHLRMCSNKKIETFHRVSLAYMDRFRDYNSMKSSLLCEECEFAATELKTVVEDERSQKKVKTFLSHEVCSRLRRYQGSCDLMLDEFLPTLFEEMGKMLTSTKQARILMQHYGDLSVAG
ncbi:unnamed protein product [Enterobius vermicularis]|uniref:Saposin B-type domain-containing protein n=1 Tax=Enterobius vermicularis TaxID=51028 RepID=A0A0N4VEM0_ENTVE|nr:unnamed protein product [Enterobius vermicularis]